MTKIQIGLAPIGPRPVGDAGVFQSIQRTKEEPLNSDGTFDLPMMPGLYRLTTRGEPAGWAAASAIAGGKDVLDVGLDVGTTDIAGVVVMLSDRHAKISGKATQADGTPAVNYFVVVFPTDRALWQMRPAAWRPRPDTNGAYYLDNLPAGEWHMAVLIDAVQDDEWQTPTLLQQAAASAIRVTVVDGQTKTQDFRVGGMPRPFSLP